MEARATRSPARLRRADRLRHRRDFQRVGREGRRRTSPHFVVLVAPGREPGRTRIGLTVSRRVAGAVGRNRVKRRVREWFRRRGDRIGPGVDVVVIARRGAAEQPARVLECELEGALR